MFLYMLYHVEFNFNTIETIDGACARMMRSALNKSWRDHVTNKELYGRIPRVTDTIREQRQRFSVNCWRNRSEVVTH